MTSHLVIPDTQVRPGVPLQHLEWLAEYAAEKQPDRIIHLGDHWDMASLSSYDRGKKTAEGRRVHADLDAGKRALDILDNRWARVRGWSPEKHLLRGNHEQRLDRHVEANPELEGTWEDPFGDADRDWHVHEFLEPVKIDGILYCHFFPANSHGKILQTRNGAPNARAQVQRQLCSCTAGHQQGLDVAIHQSPNGVQRGIIAGSFYLHHEPYLGPKSCQNYWRGVLMKHEVKRGNYCLVEVSINWLRNKYA